MKYALDAAGMKKIDDYTVETVGIPAMELMEGAAGALVEVMQQRITRQDRILAVCGPGNNGGDGVAAARILVRQGYQASILLVGEPGKYSPQMKEQLQMAKKLEVPEENCNKLAEYNIIIDAVFGVGLSKPVSGEYQEMIQKINDLDNYVYSVDIPSGVSADNGRILNIAVEADETVTFGFNKIGLLLYPGADYAGRVTVADIGFPEIASKQISLNTFYYEKEDLARLPRRKNYSHKGTYGKVLMITGSRGMAGAACLSARAAYRSGAGLVKVVSAECNRIVLQTSLPEALFASYDGDDKSPQQLQEQLLADIGWATVIVIGPGLGTSAVSRRLLETVLQNAKVPVIVDADGINLLALELEEHLGSSRRNSLQERMELLSSLVDTPVVFTPHLLEFSRLLGCSLTEITDSLMDRVNQCAGHSKLIHVVKDARTIVAGNQKYYINISGNHGMATGGSGDVLTGIIAALIAQGMGPYEASCLGVYLHGLAGDAAAREKGTYSMMAGDIAASIEKVLVSVNF